MTTVFVLFCFSAGKQKNTTKANHPIKKEEQRNRGSIQDVSFSYTEFYNEWSEHKKTQQETFP